MRNFQLITNGDGGDDGSEYGDGRPQSPAVDAYPFRSASYTSEDP